MDELPLPTFATYIQLCFGVNTAFAALHEKVCDQVEARLMTKARELGLKVIQAPPMGSVAEPYRCSPEEIMERIRKEVDERVKWPLRWMIACAFLSALWLYLMDAAPGSWWYWIGFASLPLPVPFFFYYYRCKSVWADKKKWLNGIRADFDKASEKSKQENKDEEVRLHAKVSSLAARVSKMSPRKMKRAGPPAEPRPIKRAAGRTGGGNMPATCQPQNAQPDAGAEPETSTDVPS